MSQALMGFLFLAVLATPPPQSPLQQQPLKTIITVHSSEFCTALVLAVRPALVGLMRNDQLIGLGHSALVAGDRDIKFGGVVESSFDQRGAATWSASSGDLALLNNRQRELASAMQQNIEMVETVLANPNAPKPDGEDKAKYASITSQLDLILGEQRKATNIIAGNADTSDLASIYNASSITGVESDHPDLPSTTAGLNGTSALDSRLTSQHNIVKFGPGATTDPTTASQVAINSAAASNTFNSPYEQLARALSVDQGLIKRTEDAASKAIIEAAEGCQ